MAWKRLSLAITALATLTIATPALADGPPVAIDTGEIAGAAEAGVTVFRGIPYAAAPVGPLRWKAPQHAIPWTGVRPATTFGAACPQGSEHKEPWAQVGAMSEDCLFLNVWRPERAGKYPVMVFLHGGGFSYGAAGVPLYDGAALAKRGAVIVTLNYRLGRLGFFAHPALTKEDPNGQLGNYGIMDQVAALQWVRRNIAKFGGDAANVTVFGESAGAGVVQILMGSPVGSGLFEKAISESGSGGTALFPIRGGPVNAEALGAMWTRSLGMAEPTPEQLRAIPVAEIIKGRGFPFIDGKVVVRSPGDSFARGTELKIPLMIGSNSNEGSLIGNNAALARPALGDAYPELLAAYAQRPSSSDAALDLAEDALSVLPSLSLADLHAAAGGTAYGFYFDQVPVDARTGSKGAEHGGEIEYLFGTRPADHRWDADDAKVSKLMGDYWVNFARTGNPNGAGAPRWPKVTGQPTAYLAIGMQTHAATLTPIEEKVQALVLQKAVAGWAAMPMP